MGLGVRSSPVHGHAGDFAQIPAAAYAAWVGVRMGRVGFALHAEMRKSAAYCKGSRSPSNLGWRSQQLLARLHVPTAHAQAT